MDEIMLRDYMNSIKGIHKTNDHKLLELIEGLNNDTKQKLIQALSNETTMDSHAKHIVDSMYHIANDKKYIGEKYDIHKAKEIYEKYHTHFVSPTSIDEVYIAINAQYHDYCELYKKWFGSNIDSKIIESAVEFWFKDVDYKGMSKVQEYFM